MVTEDNVPTLIRITPGCKISTVIVVGNGLVENGWKPFMKFLEKRYGYPVNLMPEELVSVMARFAFEERTMRHEIVLNCTEQTGRLLEVSYGLANNIRTDARMGIAEEYNTSSMLALKNLSQLESMLVQGSVGVVTTNWDNLLWSWRDKADKRINNLIHLHGICTFPETMVLPTEIVLDDEMIDILARNGCPDHKIEALKKAFRGDFRGVLRSAHALAWEWIRDCQRLVIVGTSLSAYDAELISFLEQWNKTGAVVGKRGTLVAINTKQEHRDLAEILLRPGRFHGINPKCDSRPLEEILALL